MGRWRKKLADRRRWKAARTLPELAYLMSLWLEGELTMWPALDELFDQRQED